MTIKQRVIKLESTLPETDEDIHVKRFIVDTGSIEPIGYRIDEGTEIMRKPDKHNSRVTPAFLLL